MSSGHLQTLIFLLLTFSTCAQSSDFVLTEHLGHRWTNERVGFTLTPDQAVQAKNNRALLGPGDTEIPYQLRVAPNQSGEQIVFQTDLAPFDRLAFRFSENAKARNGITDLIIQESASEIHIENDVVGLIIRKKLGRGQGPIAAIRLRSGAWTGGSSLSQISRVKGYSVQITADGPVFVEVECRLEFSDGGYWNLRFRIESNEPVVLVEESFDTPGKGVFKVALGNEIFLPTHLLYRSGKGGNLGKVASLAIGKDEKFTLEPWLHWWESDLQGNWLALYSPEAEHTDMLMIGLLRPSSWIDPEWSGKADQVKARIIAGAKDGVMTAVFPLGGGSRYWMLGTPDKEKSVSVLSEKQLKVAPLPQQLLIKHGDFPLDSVKDSILEWEDDAGFYPRLFFDQQTFQTLRDSLQSEPEELQRWERRQPIDKYHIDGPLHEYFASGSVLLGDKIIQTSSAWLDNVVSGDLLMQNSRVTLGVAPHGQAVLLLPTLNLVDAALSVESMSPEVRRQFLAKLAFLAYVVNSEDYWSPAREFSANPNMTTTVAQFQVTLAALIPSHPMAQQWANNGLETLLWQLNAWSDEEGGWLEAPHYAVVAYDHMLAAFIMAARAGFADHVFDERMRKVAEWLARISTPRDPKTEGFRHLPPIGNTYYGESSGIFCVVAGVWEDQDPAFAAQMQWMCDEQGASSLGLGWSFPSMAGYKSLLMANEIEAQRPEYGSVWFPQTGVVLRNGIGSSRETYLHLIAGENHEHYDYDSGSVIVWGKGQVLADDWGYIGRHGEKYHSLVSSMTTHGKMRVTEFSTQPALDYVSGQKLAWQRQVEFIKDKDPLGPNFFLLRDTHHFGVRAEWKLWLAVKSDDDSVRILDDRVSVSGNEDVDFDLFFYQPDLLDLRTETVSQDMSVGRGDGKVGPMTLTQTALIASIKKSDSVTVVVYPRLKQEPPPSVVWHADGRIVEVRSTAGTDYVFLSAQSESDAEKGFKVSGSNLSFRGTAGAVQVRQRNIKLSLGSAGSIRLGEQVLSAEIATALEGILQPDTELP